MKKYILPFLVLLMVSSTSWGKSIELDMHNKALSLNYINDDSIFIKGMNIEGGFLKRESIKSPLLHLGLNVAGKNISEKIVFDINVGGRIYLFQQSGSSLTAIALGGKVRFTPMNRLGLSAQLYFAPDITTFRDSNGMTDVTLRVDYQVIPQAFVYIGHRQMTIKLEGANAKLENDFHIGVKLLF